MVVNIGCLPIDSSIPPYLIAEIGLCHNGSVAIAKELIYQAFLSGATLVKFQKRDIYSLLNKSSSNRSFIKVPSLGTTQYEVRPKLEFDLAEYKELFSYSRSLGLIPFATIFDHNSLEFILSLEPAYLKIASHSSSDYPLIKSVINTKIPFMISTGGLTEEEREQLLMILPKEQAILMHCVSSYPSKPNEQYINTITQYINKGYVTGFSTHEIGFTASILAAGLGAKFIERHITLSNASVGFDHGISMEPNNFKKLALELKLVNQMIGIKDELLDVELSARTNYHCGVFVNRDIKQGEIITMNDIYLQQPLGTNKDSITGLGFNSLHDKSSLNNISKGSQLLKSNFNNYDRVNMIN